jgi:methionyl-tRNA synthetase
MSLAQEVNRYLEEKAPWKTIKEDVGAAATSIYVALSVISYLKVALYPFLPFSSQKLHQLLGFKDRVEEGSWMPLSPLPGQSLPPPEPLFTKLDDKIVEEEWKRGGAPC